MPTYLAQKWKETLIVVLATCLAYSISRVTSDVVSFRDKLNRLPEPSDIATKNLLDEKVHTVNDKVDSNNKDTKESLKRIEGKLDSLMLSLAVRSRESHPKELSGIPLTKRVPGAPIASASASRGTFIR